MTGGKRDGVILLLEDDDLDAELLCAALNDAGLAFDVRRATDESSYVEILRAHPVELILSDFSLPAYDGMKALAVARQLAPEAPFIFVSGAIGEERAIETMRNGATDYVLKSRLFRLVPAVRRALAESESVRMRAAAERERDGLLVLERQAREAAEAANQMKDDFLALVSHELRTPLSAITGWVSLLMMGKVDDAKLSRGLATIQRNARVQARIIEDILDISRIISGKLALRMTNTSASSFLLAAVDAVRPTATAKDLQLDVDVEDDVGEVLGDGERLQQVVWNLLTNAVKFTPAAGKVRVRAARTGETLQISVQDTGCGIAAEQLPHVFERFRQVDSSKTRENGGLGLGLAIARHIAEMHGGSVNATSPGLGHGACFTITLPAERQASVPLTQLRKDSQPLGDLQSLEGTRVLVVDDEPDAREVVCEIFTNLGASVFVCDSANAALAGITQFRPHVLVSDIGMPQQDGYSLIRAVRTNEDRELGAIPAIALTAYARQSDRVEAEGAGFQVHLAKPVVPEELVAAVRKLASAKLPLLGG